MILAQNHGGLPKSHQYSHEVFFSEIVLVQGLYCLFQKFVHMPRLHCLLALKKIVFITHPILHRLV
jgi:hypothetical protein